MNCIARFHLGLLALAGLVVTGCGYSTAPVHRTDVKTVAAPIFASKEFRRNLEFGLSSELVKCIELRTPYKVVQNAKKADTQNYQVTMTCWFEWKDLRTGEILARRDNLGAMGTYATSFGETLDSATAQTTRRLAERIVEAMEKPW